VLLEDQELFPLGTPVFASSFQWVYIFYFVHLHTGIFTFVA
jgi:hypothetical protein